MMLPSSIHTMAQAQMPLYTTPIATTGNITLEQPSSAALRLPSYHYAPSLAPLPTTAPMTATAFLDPRVTTTDQQTQLMPLAMPSTNYPNAWPWPGGVAATVMTGNGDGSMLLPQGAEMTNGLYKDMSGKILKRFLLDRPELYTNYLKARTNGEGQASTHNGNNNNNNGNEGMSGRGSDTMQTTSGSNNGSGFGFNADSFFAQEGE